MKTVKVRTEQYMRTVGYFGAKKAMNEGKLKEHNKRKMMVG